MKKRLTAAILAVILAATLTGCMGRTSQTSYMSMEVPAGTYDESLLTGNYWGYEEYDMYYEFTADHEWFFRNKQTNEAESSGTYSFDGSKISIGNAEVPDAVTLYVQDDKTIRDPDGDYLTVYVPVG